MSKVRSLKTQNARWIYALVALDCLIVFLATVDLGADASAYLKSAAGRVAVATFLPVLVLLLSSQLSSSAKDVLVFWRVKDVLPGHRAFSVHAEADPRVDLASLRKNVGAFPLEAREQNSSWYRLYKRVESEISVAEAQRNFLLFRDAAAISALLMLGLGNFRLVDRQEISWVGVALLLMAGQYLLCAVAARHHANRFVRNVLALHSQRRIVAAGPAKPRARAKSGE